MKKKKKTIIILIIILILLIITTLSIYFIIQNNNKNKLNININDEITLKYNEEFYNIDAVKKIKNGEVVTDKEKVDTTTLGLQEYKIKVKDKKNKEYTYKIRINVIDDEAPVLEYNDTITTTEGSILDLTRNVKVTDNYDTDLKVTVEGEYSYDTVGEYDLTYVVKDSSGNETKGNFKLIVEKKKEVVIINKKMEDTTFTTSKGYSGVIKNGIAYIDGYLIANKTYYLPQNYNPGLDSTTNNQANKMFEAAKNEKGYNLYIASGFRSYSTQESIYNRYVSRDGVTKADTYSARPGHSEHQSGLAFDVCDRNVSACITSGFNNTEQAEWLKNNAHKYGFILRYPAGKTNETGYIHESWHFRYVGVELATTLYNNGNWITMEDYFGITSIYE